MDMGGDSLIKYEIITTVDSLEIIYKNRNEQLLELNWRRVVKLFYYDNKEKTPDITMKLILPDETVEYQVDTCLVNKFQDVSWYNWKGVISNLL